MKKLFVLLMLSPLMAVAQQSAEQSNVAPQAEAQVWQAIRGMENWCGAGSDTLCYGRFPGATCNAGPGKYGTCQGFPNGDRGATCTCIGI